MLRESLSPALNRVVVGLYASLALITLCWPSVAGASGNLLSNGDFEAQFTEGLPPGWPELFQATYGREIMVSDVRASSGRRSLRIEDRSEKGYGIRSEHVPVEAGKTYRVEAKVWNEEGVAQVYLEFWDSRKNRVKVYIETQSERGSWQPLSVVGQAPSDAVTATVLLYSHGANQGISYYDEVKLVLGDRASEFEAIMLKVLHDYGGIPLKMAATGHPRLYFSAERLSALRELSGRYATNFFGQSGAGLAQAVIMQAESYLRENEMTLTYFGGYKVTFKLPPEQPPEMENPPGFPSAYGHYPYWTALSRNIQVRLETLSLAYSLTGRAEFGERAREYALSLARWKDWSDPQYVSGAGITCLDTSHFTMGIVAAYDMAYDLFTDAEREEIRKAILNKAMIPFAYDLIPIEGKARIDNGQALRAAGLGIGALAILGEEPMALPFLGLARAYLLWFVDKMAADSDSEGMMYTSYATDTLVRFADILYRVTGDEEAFRSPYLASAVPDVCLYFRGGLRNFFEDTSKAAHFGLTMLILNSTYGNPLAGWYLAETGAAPGGLDGLVHYQERPKIRFPDKLPTSAVIPAFGWASLQSGWNSSSATLAFKSNAAIQGHTHMDQNNFTLFARGEWLATDQGYHVFDAGPKAAFTSGSVGHNTVLVDGKGQTRRGGGKIERFMCSPFYDVVSGEASRAYEDLGLFRRRIAQSKIPGGDEVFRDFGYLYVMYDELNAGTPRTYEWLLHTDTDAMRVLGNHILIEKAAANLSATVVLPDGVMMTGGAQGDGVQKGGTQGNEASIEVRRYKGAEEFGPYAVVKIPGSERAEYLTVLHVAPRDLLPGSEGEPVIENISHARMAGVRVIRKHEGECLEDLFFFRRSEDMASGGEGAPEGESGSISRSGEGAPDISFDGDEAFVRRTGTEVLAYAAYGVRSLSLEGRPLISSAMPVRIGVGWDDEDEVVRIHIEADAAGEVRFHLPGPVSRFAAGGWTLGRVVDDGDPHPLPEGALRYDGRMVILGVEAGISDLIWYEQ